MATKGTSGERAYGIDEFTSADQKQLILEELRIKGFAVLEGVLSPADVESYCMKIDEIYAKQEEEFGSEKLKQISDQNTARCPLSYDESFLDLITHPKVKSIIESVLGSYYLLHLQNGIISRPSLEHHQAAWHRDLPYQTFVSSKPLAVNAYYCLCDYTPETGATMLLPHSHCIEDIPSLEYLNKHGVTAEAPAGSVVFFDSMCFHRAGLNCSPIVRRGINQVYTAGIIKQQIQLSQTLKSEYADDPYLAMLLGYASDAATSVDDWRDRRLAKVN